jgi:hypothetical protein
MAIHEYYSPENHRIYSFYAQTISQGDKLPRCPDNPNYEMVKMISSFSVTGNKDNSEDESMGSHISDHDLQAAMAEMENEITGIDEENPDPRQLGHLMRKMTEMSGEKMPERMEEIMCRLEAGEDPEKLEEEFGDMLEDEEETSENPTEKNENKKSEKQLLTRDPQLYNISDYT